MQFKIGAAVCFVAYLILISISLDSRSLQISSCCKPDAFSLEIKNVQFLSMAEVMVTAGMVEGGDDQ